MALITVAISTRNRGRFLGPSIRSILDQDIDVAIRVVRTQGDVEVPAVPEVHDPRVEVLQCPHSPRGTEGWLVALGDVDTEWAMTFDDDDLMVPGSLSKLLTIAESRGYDLVTGIEERISEGADIEDLGEAEWPDPITVSPLTWEELATPPFWFPNMGNTLWRASLSRAFLGDNTPPGGDLWFGTVLFAASSNAVIVNIPFRAHRRHGASATSALNATSSDAMFAEWIAWASGAFPEFARARVASQ